MTRDEFLKHAEAEIEAAFKPAKGRLMNLVQQAWAEGKKNAESAYIDEIGYDILEQLKKKLELDKPSITITTPQIGEIPAPKPIPLTIPVDPIINKIVGDKSDIPIGCRNCPNHPSNGGSGICHCIIGTQPIMCNTTATAISDAIANDKMSDLAFTVANAVGNAHDLEVYNAACDNHIHIIHDIMTGAKIDAEEKE